MTTTQDDVLIAVPEDHAGDEPVRETWVGEQVRLLALEDGFA